MACQNCVFYAGDYPVYKAEQGYCTRYPEHKRVDKDHFCGEMIVSLGDDFYRKKTRPVDDVYRSHNKGSWDEHYKTKQDNASLRQEVKTLRSLYKGATGKAAIIRKATPESK